MSTDPYAAIKGLCAKLESEGVSAASSPGAIWGISQLGLDLCPGAPPR